MISDEMIALAKGMLDRGDRQSDIAACFLENGGRIAEIHNAMTRSHAPGEVALTTRAREISATALEQLPPAGPYPSPYELWTSGQSLWAARVALEHTKEKIELALVAIAKAEGRIKE